MAATGLLIKGPEGLQPQMSPLGLIPVMLNMCH